jgi:hypothetical protein
MATDAEHNGLLVFRRDFLNANTWAQRKDGVPLELLDNLTPQELKIAEKELLAQASLHDSWLIIALGHIRSEKSLPRLYKLLKTAACDFKVIVARSIYLINQDANIIPVVLDELSRAEDWEAFELIDILWMLPDFNSAEIDRRLETFADSGKYLVAYNAARVLGRLTEPIVEKFKERKGKKK